MDMLLRSHGLDTLVYGTRKCPVVGEDSTNEEKREQQKWMKDDAKAASLIACSLSRNIAELVLTCKHANEIWTKLLARFERSNVQRLNSLIEKFFKVERDTSEDISTHIAKLQKLFMDLNNELEKNNENRLSDKILNGRILSTLDEKSRWTEVYFIRKKSQVLEKFKEFRAKMEKLTERKIKFLQSDNGTEYVNNEFDKYLKENGIQRRLSISYSPQQNGISERKNRTLLDMARCLLIQAGMKPSFWAEAVNTANYIRNRCPTSAQNSSPYEILFGKQPYLGHMKEFGCDVFVKNNAPNKDKFQPRAQKMIFVGYSSQSKGYRVYDPNKNKFEDVRDVYFREGRKRDNDEFENFYVHKPKPNGTETGSGNGTRSPTISNETDDTNSTGSESEESKSDDNGNVCEESSEEEVQEEPGRAPGRPKTIRTGKPGRPRKEYRIRTNKNGNSSEAPASVEEAFERPDKNL
ncbi:UNVERIFIED_CONTAM: hypothetical protein PYX00_009318 [Menopon gallinae]|uniref:Integrase catalytic domain-containing protein n=1 Tax=Menopon gallinae TaxID=328185 RepID=A0AAW2HB10_9NEOP